ncbi:MAG: hypothetical protein WA782_20270 [Sulfitobacter sp.]
MSASDDQVLMWREHIQNAIDNRPDDGDASRFTFEELFSDAEWRDFTLALKLATSVTEAFKRRIVGFENANDPVFLNIEWTGDINSHGRTVNFKKIAGAA